MKLRALESAVLRALGAIGAPCCRRDARRGSLRGRRLGGPHRRPRHPFAAAWASASWPLTSTMASAPTRRRTPRSADDLCRELGIELRARPGRRAGPVAARALRASKTRPAASATPFCARCRRTRGPWPSRWPTPATTRRRRCSCGCSAAPGPTGLSAMRREGGTTDPARCSGSRGEPSAATSRRGAGLARGPDERRPRVPAQPRPPRAPAPPRGPLQPAASRDPRPDRASLLADEAALLEELADAALDARRPRRGRGRRADASGAGAGSPRPLARLALRRALAEAGGLRGRLGRARREARSISLRSPAPRAAGCPSRGTRGPGGLRRADRLGLAASAPRRPFALNVDRPRTGRRSRTDRPSSAEAARGPAVSNGGDGVVAAPEGWRDLVVRTRRPGDRVRFRGRQISLKRFLMDRRVGRSPAAGPAPRGRGRRRSCSSRASRWRARPDDLREALARGRTFILMQKPEVALHRRADPRPRAGRWEPRSGPPSRAESSR